MLDGLWVGEWFSNVSNIHISSGVIVFREGKVFGGNDRVYITGDFNSADNRFDADIGITYYAGEPLGIFGLIDVNQTEHMLITGHCSGDEIKLEGTMKSDRKVRLYGLLHKKAGGEIFYLTEYERVSG
jgi:hypothetical protein